MRRLKGLAASRGYAIGPLRRYVHKDLNVTRVSVDDVEAEISRFGACRVTIDDALAAMAKDLTERVGAEHGEIFEIQREFLDDPGFGGAIVDLVREKSINAEAAVQEVGEELIAEFEAIGDEYFSQRAVDIRDLRDRMLRELLGVSGPDVADVSEPVVLLAHDLTPSDTATLPLDKTLALCTEIGGRTSHTAILSRSLGIPSIVGMGNVTIADDSMVIVDAVQGLVIVDPDDATIASYREKADDFAQRQSKLKEQAKEPAITLDGYELEIAANIAGAHDAEFAVDMGADGVGLLRTEFLFLDRADLPDEEEQYKSYRAVLDHFPDRMVIIRTLDVGGDKQLPSVEIPPEENPFLGLRAIRLAFSEPDRLLIPQIKAIFRAAVGRKVRIMFPMIGSVAEVIRVRSAIDKATEAMDLAGVEYSKDVEIGIMIEIPSAAIIVERFAPYVDFFSIGTNDLTQYTLAVDRTNQTVAYLADSFHPGVLALINRTVEGAHAHGKWVGVCGEMAGEAAAVPLLVGLGVDELSMAPSVIPAVKDLVRSIRLIEVQELARKCLAAPTAAEIRELVHANFDEPIE